MHLSPFYYSTGSSLLDLFIYALFTVKIQILQIKTVHHNAIKKGFISEIKKTLFFRAGAG